MAGGFAALEKGFPDLSAVDGTERKLLALQDYLVQLLEQLRWALRNLSAENFNTAEVSGWLGETITEPIRAELADTARGLSARIEVNAAGIVSEAERAAGAEGALRSRVTQTADAITAEVSRATAAEGTLGSRITQTADAITSEVTRAAGAESAIRQTADAVRAQVTDGQGNYTVLNLRADGLHIGSAAGTTKISGGCLTAGSVTAGEIAAHTITGNEIAAGTITGNEIAAGTITANEIDAANLHVSAANIDGTITADAVDAGWVYAGAIDAAQITSGSIVADAVSADGVTAGDLTATGIRLIDRFSVYAPAGGTQLLVGTLGAGQGNDGTGETWGVKLGSPYSQIYFIVTDAGVRMQCFNASIFVTSGGCWAKYGNKLVDLIDLADRVAALEAN